MNFRAILFGSLQLFILTVVLLLLTVLMGVEAATGPQILTLSSLLIWPGLYTGLRAKDGGIIHGLLAGMLGAVLVIIGFTLLQQFMIMPALLSQLAVKNFLLIGVLCGLWGGVGGIFSDIVRIKRLRKKAK